MRAWLSVGVMTLCLFVSTSAMAQDEKTIALIHIEISGDGPPELRQQLQTHLSKALTAEGLKVTSLDQTLKALKSVPELIGCSSTACLDRIYALVPAHRFIRALVTASGANYEIQLTLLGPLEDESLLSTVSESCAVCTISDLNELAGEAARKLLKPNSEQELSVEIATNPPGATILIDAIEVGESPIDTDLKVGSYSVTAKLEGHASTEKIIEVVANASEEQRFELLLTKMAAMKKDTGSAADYGNKKWIALGASLGLLTLGTVLVAIDGDPSCGSSTATCPNTRKTLTGGIVSLTGGVVIGGLSGWMFWRESATKNEGQVSLQATQGGGIAGYGFQF